MRKVYKFNEYQSALDIEVRKSGDKKTAIVQQGSAIIVLNRKLWTDIGRYSQWD
jgi:hypothetical protein